MSNWYIDFDSTLYNTNALINDMLEIIANYIYEYKNENKEEILEKLYNIFHRDNIYNIFELCDFFEDKYELPNSSLSIRIKQVLDSGEKYIYNDVVPFLEKLQSQNDNLNILTKVTDKNGMYFHTKKVAGSGITQYFNSIIFTANPKDQLDILYNNGIFVDDNPSQAENLYKSGALKVFRLRRPNDRYSDKNLNISEIEEYTSLSQIQYKEE